MGITMKDIIKLREEVTKRNKPNHSMCVVITRETAIYLYNELFGKGLMKEAELNEDEICKRIHNSKLFGATIKVKGLS